MAFKLKTSTKTEKIFKTIGLNTGLQPFALSKIAISLVIRDGKKAADFEMETDNNGLELNRQTITGDYDLLFSLLILKNEGTFIDDKDLFPKYFKSYIDYGAILLEREYRYNKNFYQQLCNLDEGI